MLLLWVFACATVAITSDYRAYPTVVATLAAFPVSVGLPSLGAYCAAATGIVFAINMTLVWRPQSILGPPRKR